MDTIRNNFVQNGEGNLVTSSPKNTIQRLLWTTTGNGYSLDSNRPLDENQMQWDYSSTNEYIYGFVLLGSNEPFSIHIDYGDGTILDKDSIYKPSVNGTYPYLIELVASISENRDIYYVRGYPGGKYVVRNKYLAIGELIDNHKYNDNEKYTVIITVTKGELQFFRSQWKNSFWPIFELPYLRSIDIPYAHDLQVNIPFNQFTYLDNLYYLNYRRGNGIYLTGLPISLFNCKSLSNISFTSSFNNFNDTIRNISNLQKLALLNIKGCTIPVDKFKYFKEYNNCKLTNIYIDSPYCNQPEFYEEVDELFPLVNQVTNYYDEVTWSLGSGDRLSIANNNNSPYCEWLSNMKGMEKVRLYNWIISNYRKSFPALPKWWDKMKNASSFFNGNVLNGEQVVLDSIIERTYERTILNPKDNTSPWYGLTCNCVNSLSTNVPRTPTGIYRAPSGFIKGESNGTPESPAEMVYVLVNNYNQAWTFYDNLPTESSRINLMTPNSDDQYEIYQNNKGIYSIKSFGSQLINDSWKFIKGFDTLEQARLYINENNIDFCNGLDDLENN